MEDVIYFAPRKIEEALQLLARYREKTTILAGGTDLVPRINYYKLRPGILLYIGGLGLDYIKKDKQRLTIGGGTSWAEIISNNWVAEKANVLAEAARQGSCVAVRNAGTIGGNLANASPAADLATPLLVMDSELLLKSMVKERLIAVKDFFTGPGETVLGPNELIIEIQIPLFKGNTVFLKLGRRKAMTLSVVNVAVRLELSNGSQGSSRTCIDARIAVGSVAPTPMRCIKTEEMLKGKVLDKTLIWEGAVKAMAETNPIDDQRATAWYRKKAGTALIARALAKAAGIQIE